MLPRFGAFSSESCVRSSCDGGMMRVMLHCTSLIPFVNIWCLLLPSVSKRLDEMEKYFYRPK